MPQFTGDKFGFGSPNATGDSGPAPFAATGGTKITSGDYTYHVFSTDHPSPEKTFTATSGTRSAEVLVVAGGGGSAWDNGGGGGGGGVAHVPAITLSPGSIAVVIGGTSDYATGRSGNFPWKGNDSTFAHPFGTITAKGGGCPGAQNATGPYEINNASEDGGSGAGGRRTNPGANNAYKANASSGIQPTQNPSYPVTVNNYGNNGGSAESGGATWWFGGGGGGAGAAGESFSGGHDGGNGQPFSNFPGPVISPGVPSPEKSAFETAVTPTGLFGGGGGGSSESPATTGEGGTGGGGDGSNPSAAVIDGIYGTGGGGGSGGGEGGAGGSGIVCIRYLT